VSGYFVLKGYDGWVVVFYLWYKDLYSSVLIFGYNFLINKVIILVDILGIGFIFAPPLEIDGEVHWELLYRGYNFFKILFILIVIKNKKGCSFASAFRV